MSYDVCFHLTFIEKTFPKRIKLVRLTYDFYMSLYRHFGYLKQIELAIHIHDLLPTVKLPLAFLVEKILMNNPVLRLGWMTSDCPVP